MLDRTIVIPVAPRLLVARQYEQWRRAIGIGVPRGSQKTTAGYRFPCWICGEEGILGVGGFGSKGLIRPRNIMHSMCYETLTTEQRRLFRHRDVKHELYRAQRRKSRRNLDRVSMRMKRASKNGNLKGR